MLQKYTNSKQKIHSFCLGNIEGDFLVKKQEKSITKWV